MGVKCFSEAPCSQSLAGDLTQALSPALVTVCSHLTAVVISLAQRLPVRISCISRFPDGGSARMSRRSPELHMSRIDLMVSPLPASPSSSVSCFQEWYHHHPVEPGSHSFFLPSLLPLFPCPSAMLAFFYFGPPSHHCAFLQFYSSAWNSLPFVTLLMHNHSSALSSLIFSLRSLL